MSENINPNEALDKMENLEQIIGNAQDFLNRVYANLSKLKIDSSAYPIDHIAFRATTNGKYAEQKNKLQKFGEVISEKIIRERPVAIIRLNTPLKLGQQTIPFFEILAPAQGDTFKEGLEHAEFVVDVPLDEFLKKYPGIDFITKALDKKINPELILRFDDGANAKFHEMPIDKVIEIEKFSK